MISDVLFDAIDSIDRWLAQSGFGYDGEMRRRIIRCRNEMERIRHELDTPPGHSSEEYPDALNLKEEDVRCLSDDDDALLPTSLTL